MTYEFTARDIHSAFMQARNEQWSFPAKTWDELLPSERWTVYGRMAALINEKLPQDFSALIDVARDAVLLRYQAQDIDFATYEQVAGSLSNARTALLLALRQPTQGVLGEEETV